MADQTRRILTVLEYQSRGDAAIRQLTNALAQREVAENRLAAAQLRSTTALVNAESATRRAASTNRALVASTDAAADATNRGRLGFAQLTPNIQDFAIQIQGGQSAMVAFTQQSSQIVSQLTVMGGAFGRVGTFLSNPWVAAVTTAIVIVSSLYTALSRTSDEAERAEKATRGLTKATELGRIGTLNLKEATEELNSATGYQVVTQREYITALIQQNKLKAEETAKTIAQTIAITEQSAAIIEQRRLMVESVRLPASEPGATGARAGASLLVGFGEAELAKTTKRLAELQQQLKNAQAQIKGGYESIAELDRAAARDAERAAKTKRPTREIQSQAESLSEYAEAVTRSAVAWANLNNYQRQFLDNSDLSSKVDAAAESFATAYEKMNYGERLLRDSERLWYEIGEAAKIAAFDIAGFSDQITDSFTGLIDKTRSVKDAFRDMVEFILKEAAKLAIAKFVTSILGAKDGAAFDASGVTPNAKGNVFGTQQRFAAGGIVNRPTNFAFSRGGVPALGLMGEAGPEAILPLSRGRDGKLGVTAQSGPNVVINNYAGAAVETSQAEDGTLTIDIVRKAVATDIARGGTLISSSMERTYGVGRNVR